MTSLIKTDHYEKNFHLVYNGNAKTVNRKIQIDLHEGNQLPALYPELWKIFSKTREPQLEPVEIVGTIHAQYTDTYDPKSIYHKAEVMLLLKYKHIPDVFGPKAFERRQNGVFNCLQKLTHLGRIPTYTRDQLEEIKKHVAGYTCISFQINHERQSTAKKRNSVFYFRRISRFDRCFFDKNTKYCILPEKSDKEFMSWLLHGRDPISKIVQIKHYSKGEVGEVKIEPWEEYLGFHYFYKIMEKQRT